MSGENSSQSDWIKQLWNLWRRLFDWIFGAEYPQTAVWRRWWAVATIASAFCSFDNMSPHHPWLDFMPGLAIGEVTLIALFLGAPFPIRQSVWTLSILPWISVWLPYFIRLFFGSPSYHPFTKFFEDHGLKFIPKLFPPDPGNPTSGAIDMAQVCLGCTLDVLATVVILALWSSKKRDRTVRPSGSTGCQ
jgi:hypothetical protein